MRDISAIVPDDVWLTSMAVAFAGDSSSGTTGQSGSTTSQSGQGAAAVTLDPVSTAVPALTVVIP
jgi:hypothetical protein